MTGLSPDGRVVLSMKDSNTARGDWRHADVSTTWHRAIIDWDQWLASASRPKTTRDLRTYQLRRFAADHGHLGPWRVGTEAMVAWLAGKTWAPESRRSYRSALRSFYGWAFFMGRISQDPAAKLPPIRNTQHPPRPAPEVVLQDALGRADHRVRLMLLLAARQGLRRGEIARLHTSDVQPDLIGWTLRVHGKGGKERVIPLLQPIAAALLDLPPGYAFPGDDEGHLSPPYVGKLMSKALGPGWTAHTLRHRFATLAYSGSRDLLAVQGLLGHANPDTTRNYVQLPDEALRSALSHAA